MQASNLKVYCLICDEIYPEEKEPVKVCPKCGNDDMYRTIYLEDNQE